MISIKRVFEKRAAADGYRVLVDRLWPRGVRKEALALNYWAKELAPSTELREFYHHDAKRWDKFVALFHEELQASPAAMKTLTVLAEKAKYVNVTLLFASREPLRNNAAVIKDVLETHF